MRKYLMLPLLMLFPAGCSTQSNLDSITTDQLSNLQSKPTLEAEHVSISCRIVEADGTVVMLPKVKTRIGRKVNAEIVREFVYATEYDLPEVGQGDHSGHLVPVLPVTPTTFETARLGEFLTLSPSIRGPFIEVSGTLTSKSADSGTRSAGEPYLPITDSTGVMLTTNKADAPEFKTIESTIRVCSLPGVEQQVRLRSQHRDFFVRIEVLD